MPVLPPADAHGLDIPRVQKCVLEFSVRIHYKSHSFRIYMLSNNVDLKNNNKIIKNVLNCMRARIAAINFFQVDLDKS